MGYLYVEGSLEVDSHFENAIGSKQLDILFIVPRLPP